METSCLSVNASGLQCAVVKVLWYSSGKGALVEIALGLGFDFFFYIKNKKKYCQLLSGVIWRSPEVLVTSQKLESLLL